VKEDDIDTALQLTLSRRERKSALVCQLPARMALSTIDIVYTISKYLLTVFELRVR
jgi:hypothetical protein